MKIEDFRVGQLVTNGDFVYRVENIFGPTKTIDVSYNPAYHPANDMNRIDFFDDCSIDLFSADLPVVKEKTHVEKILESVDGILKRGTSFAGFDYHGKRRNVLVGAESCDGYLPWGEYVNRAIVKHNGKFYLCAVEMTDGQMIKNFELSKISNWTVK